MPGSQNFRIGVKNQDQEKLENQILNDNLELEKQEEH